MPFSAMNPTLKLLAVEEELARSELELLLVTKGDCLGPSLFSSDESINRDVDCIRTNVFEPVLNDLHVSPWGSSGSALYISVDIPIFMKKFADASIIGKGWGLVRSLAGSSPTKCWKFKFPGEASGSSDIVLYFVFYAGTEAKFSVVRDDFVGDMKFGQLELTTLWKHGRVSTDMEVNNMKSIVKERVVTEKNRAESKHKDK